MRYFLRLAYNGAPFHGWQRQPNAISVQQVIEEALYTVMRCPIDIVGAGRTDTGVNAREMYAHFDADPIPENQLPSIVKALNSLCGRDICIYDAFPVSDDTHARFSALRRTYKYFITSVRNPFLYPLAWYCPSKLNVDAMNEAAAQLLQISDFTSFAKLHSDAQTNICNVYQAVWQPLSEIGDFCGLGQSGLVFTISADRFLRNMVRAVVGTLLDVGRGRLSFAEFMRVIECRDRCAAGQSVPGNALYLWSVEYSFNANR